MNILKKKHYIFDFFEKKHVFSQFSRFSSKFWQIFQDPTFGGKFSKIGAKKLHEPNFRRLYLYAQMEFDNMLGHF